MFRAGDRRAETSGDGTETFSRCSSFLFDEPLDEVYPTVEITGW
jgi:hypothetical protein